MDQGIPTAYAEIGKAYEIAVQVSLFTWRMFYLRSVAVFTAAGYLAFLRNQKAFAIGLLVISAAMTLAITKKQMHDNQRVIQKLLAAGFLLESRNEGLGYRYMHEIHSDDPNEEQNLIEWDQKRKDIILKYSKTSAEDPAQYIHQWVDPSDWKYFGIYPNLTAFAVIYGSVHVIFAIGLLFIQKQ